MGVIITQQLTERAEAIVRRGHAVPGEFEGVRHQIAVAVVFVNKQQVLLHDLPMSILGGFRGGSLLSLHQRMDSVDRAYYMKTARLSRRTALERENVIVCILIGVFYFFLKQTRGFADEAHVSVAP